MNNKVRASIEYLSQMADLPLREYRDAILEELCTISGSTLSYVAAMNLEEDMLTMVGWSKSAMGSCALTEQPIVYELTETGLWGDAVRERRPVITNDYQNLVKPTKKGYPEGHVQVHRHMNLPIFEDGRVVLVIGVGNKQDEYTLDDAADIEALMNEIWSSFRISLWQATW